jgi:hypothetical protein
MSKHHASALIFLGIAVCAGFLLSVPAVAGSGQGLQALESGELFQSPFTNLPRAGNGSEPSGSPVPTVVEETYTALAETTMPADPDYVSMYADPVPMAGTTPGVTGEYDDERLARLINTAGISLMRLSMEHAHALYLQDTDAASVAADDLHALSIRLLGEVQPLQVSPEQQPVKDEFIRSLSAYSTASERLLGTTDAGEDTVPTALSDLAAASQGIEAVSRQAVEVQPASHGVPVSYASTVMTADVETPAYGESPAVVETPAVRTTPPAESLPIGERYTYDDQEGENMISLLADSTRTITSYETTDANRSTVKNEAGAGRTFLLVIVKSTNLGHKGDSDLYTIETPGRDAFTLEHQGTTYKPLESPSFTSLGESFDRKPLERYDVLKGYLYFDVPETLDVSEATLSADLGYAGTPVWDLGREPGKEPTAVNAA